MAKADGLLGSLVVRVPRSAKAELSAAGIAAQRIQDYRSFLWLEVSPAELAKLQASGVKAEVQHEARQVQVTAHRFDPLSDGEPDVALKSSQADGRGFRLVQFEGPVRQEWLESLRGAGLAPLQYYPHNAYLVWSEGRATEAMASLDFVRWHGAFHPSYKLNSDLEGRDGRVGNVTVVFYNDGNTEKVLQTLQGLGARVLGHHPSQPDRAFFDAVVEIDAAALESVAALDNVLWLGYSHPEPVLEDEMSGQILAGNHPGGTPVTGYLAYLGGLGYTGTGVRWAVVDTGVDYDHPDLGPNIVAGMSFPGACNPAGQPGSDCSGGGHGTHVAGIIGGTAAGAFADGAGFLYGLGVAPDYDIVAMNSLSGSSWPPTGGWQEHSKQALLMSAVGTNNSWTTGEGTAHGYQASERTHDLMVHDGNFDTAAIEPIIWVFSAGNSGPGASTITSPKEAKNTIAVGSSRNFRVGNIDTLSSFSSRGPAVDGRIFPTISAPGEEIASSRNDLGGSCSTAIGGTSNLYAFCSGTSMASPQVAGALVLATEWWRDFNLGANPSPAMAKALLVNSAVDMGAADRPNNNEGWGRISIERMIAPANPTLYRDQEVVFADPGEFFNLTVSPVNPAQPVQITVAWTDAAGAIGANPALVNNLDLSVVDGGNTYLGNRFNAGWSIIGGAADTLHNLENVYIQNPDGGAIDITVSASNIAGDGVLGNADPTDQNFALVCSNCVSQPDYTLTLDPTELSICAPDPGASTVTIGSLLGYTDPVSLNVSGAPAGLNLSFGTNPLTPPDSTQLTLTNTQLATPGSYAMLVEATSTSGNRQRQLDLELFSAVPSAPAALLPADGATSVDVSPTLSWDPASEATSYLVEVATDAGFGDIVFSEVVNATSAEVDSLAPSTQFFWRVRAENGCGAGTFSTVHNFTTAAIACTVFPATGLPLLIPPSGTSGVTNSSITIPAPQGGTIIDVDVLGLSGTHTWMGDLDFRLISPAGTSIEIMERTCGDTDNFNINFDDDAVPGAWPCPPIDGGTYQPTEPLAGFNGEETAGTWTLRVTDNAGGDSGQLNDWDLRICRSVPFNAVDDSYSVAQNGVLNVPAPGVLDNDVGSGLSATLVDDVAEGLLNFNADGSFDYTPTTGYCGPDAFSYEMTDGIGTDQGLVEIEVICPNDPPVVQDQAFAVDENSANGSVVGSILASDPDVGDTLSFAVTGGSGASAFAVNSSNGEITVANAALLDFETSTSFTLQVTVTDAGMLSDSATITIDINDVNEAPAVADQAFAVNENSINGSVVDSIVASDPDAGDVLSFAVTGGSGASAFAVDSGSGEITVTDASLLDFETSTSFTLQVTVTDIGALSDSATITINLNDVNEAPTGGVLADQSGAEGVLFTFDSSTAFADPDSDALGYSVDGLPGALSIDPNSGVISGVPLVGQAGTYSVTVTATDGSLQVQASFELVIDAAGEGIFGDGFEE